VISRTGRGSAGGAWIHRSERRVYVAESQRAAWEPSRLLLPASAVRSGAIRPEGEPPQVAADGALGAVELSRELIQPRAVVEVPGPIELLQASEPEHASTQLAALKVRGRACAAEPRARRGELSLALERDRPLAQRRIGLARRASATPATIARLSRGSFAIWRRMR
jgi:hypothetical protein